MRRESLHGADNGDGDDDAVQEEEGQQQDDVVRRNEMKKMTANFLCAIVLCSVMMCCVRSQSQLVSIVIQAIAAALLHEPFSSSSEDPNNVD